MRTGLLRTRHEYIELSAVSVIAGREFTIIDKREGMACGTDHTPHILKPFRKLGNCKGGW